MKEIQNLDSGELKGKIAHWAAFHASHQKGVPTRMVSSAVLPLFYEAAHSVSMMKHSIDISLYALCKQLQWQYPEIYGISKAFFILGGLHIEKQIEQILGSYYKGSGLTDLLVISKVCSAFLSGSFITRTRYNYEVIASTLNNLLHESFKLSGETDMRKWIDASISSSAQFKYWYLGLEFLLKFLLYVRSI